MHRRRQEELRQGGHRGHEGRGRIDLQRRHRRLLTQSPRPCSRWGPLGGAITRRTLTLGVSAAILSVVPTGCLGADKLRTELHVPATRHDAIGLSDALESLVDEDRVTPRDRQDAYNAVRQWKQKTAAYAYARANLAGRVAELKGLAAAQLIDDMERWARVSLALNPKFRRGAARRMLGTLYVLAPASFVRFGDSEDGLELLEEQVQRYPRDARNHLRLAEGFMALDDEESAYEYLCICLKRQDELRPSEQRLLTALVKQVGGAEMLECDDA